MVRAQGEERAAEAGLRPCVPLIGRAGMMVSLSRGKRSRPDKWCAKYANPAGGKPNVFR